MLDPPACVGFFLGHEDALLQVQTRTVVKLREWLPLAGEKSIRYRPAIFLFVTVTNNVRLKMIPAPYPKSVAAQGWRLDIDYQRLVQSDTWLLSTPEQQAYLLKLLLISWQQIPAGTLPQNKKIIAAALGLDEPKFTEWAEVLLRGWVLADDGRLYHPVMIENVLEMCKKRDSNAKRQQNYRQNKRSVTRDNSVTNALVVSDYTVSNDTNTNTNTDTNKVNTDIDTSTQEQKAETNPIQKPAKSGLPPAPYRQIIDLYHEILPELPRVIVETEDRKRLVKSFWNWVLTSTKASGARRAETASEAIEYCKIYFDLARGNDFVMGRTERSKDHRNWKASIDYLLSDKGKKQIIENA